MTYLLDTHTLLWWLFDDPRLSPTARGLIADPANAVVVSAASAWEIATKHRLGRLPAAAQLLRDYDGWLQTAGFRELSITSADAVRAGSFAQPHRDPFDRMIAAQGLRENAPILGRDQELAQFGVQLIW